MLNIPNDIIKCLHFFWFDLKLGLLVFGSNENKKSCFRNLLTFTFMKFTKTPRIIIILQKLISCYHISFLKNKLPLSVLKKTLSVYWKKIPISVPKKTSLFHRFLHSKATGMASHLNGGHQGGHCQAPGNKITVVEFQPQIREQIFGPKIS